MLRSGFIFLLACLWSACQPSSGDQGQTAREVITPVATMRIDSTLASFVSNERAAGVSALIYEQGREAYYGAFGFADREAEVPMQRNTIVQVWSMTKPVTAAALMALHEEGAFALDDPVEQYLPEFEQLEVYDGLDPDGSIRTIPTRRKMTIADLTRHTAGFCNNKNVPGLSELIAAIDPRSWERTLDDMVAQFAAIPLWTHPGDRWEYGPGMDIEAALIQRISGVPYHQFLQERILSPLGLDEVRYFVPETER
ncbi:MAG: serine hydrolase domain-containing protein, partial [Saprospiraceae bacterium]|nr:serine hydrolase domain-containing protein [Saprospiraceae bacterium]